MSVIPTKSGDRTAASAWTDRRSEQGDAAAAADFAALFGAAWLQQAQGAGQNAAASRSNTVNDNASPAIGPASNESRAAQSTVLPREASQAPASSTAEKADTPDSVRMDRSADRSPDARSERPADARADRSAARNPSGQQRGTAAADADNGAASETRQVNDSTADARADKPVKTEAQTGRRESDALTAKKLARTVKASAQGTAANAAKPSGVDNAATEAAGGMRSAKTMAPSGQDTNDKAASAAGDLTPDAVTAASAQTTASAVTSAEASAETGADSALSAIVAANSAAMAVDASSGSQMGNGSDRPAREADTLAMSAGSSRRTGLDASTLTSAQQTLASAVNSTALQGKDSTKEALAASASAAANSALNTPAAQQAGSAVTASAAGAAVTANAAGAALIAGAAGAENGNALADMQANATVVAAESSPAASVRTAGASVGDAAQSVKASALSQNGSSTATAALTAKVPDAASGPGNGAVASAVNASAAVAEPAAKDKTVAGTAALEKTGNSADPRPAAAGVLRATSMDASANTNSNTPLNASIGNATLSAAERLSSDRAASASAGTPAVSPAVLNGLNAFQSVAATQDDAPKLVMSTPITDPGFADELHDTVQLVSTRGLQSVEISITPAELGPIKLKVDMTGNQAEVRFEAAQEATRTLLADAVPALKEQLAQSGIDLRHASVDRNGMASGNPSSQGGLTQGGQGQGNQTGQGQQGSRYGNAGSDSGRNSNTDVAQQPAVQRVRNALLDTYA